MTRRKSKSKTQQQRDDEELQALLTHSESPLEKKARDLVRRYGLKRGRGRGSDKGSIAAKASKLKQVNPKFYTKGTITGRTSSK